MPRPSLTPTRTAAESRARELVLPGASLLVQVPGEAERFVALELRPLTVGAQPDCDVVISGAGVSRRHCEISLVPEGVHIRDLGSKNGTFIGSVPVRDALLPKGEVVRIGAAQLRLQVAKRPLTVPLSPTASFGPALGASAAMRALFAVLEAAASTDEPVLLLGASGTGKELLAQGVHQHSHRSSGPFVVVDCSALPPQLIEAELFGHLKGAFSGADESRTGLLAEASGGTLFLDEMGELPLELQPKLLRALEAKQIRPVGGNRYQSIDVRIVAATNRDLRAQVAAGKFREDLFYRLAVIEARVPPLRERKDDIPLLVEHFLSGRSQPTSINDLPPGTLELFAAYDWPGNVRELRSAVARLLLFPAERNVALAAAGAPSSLGYARLTHLKLREARALVVAEFERAYLAAQLKEHGTPSLAGKAMGVSRQLVHRLMQQHGLVHRG